MEKSGIASVNIEQACTNFICYRSVYYLAKLSESRHLTCSSTSCRTPSSATLDLQSARFFLHFPPSTHRGLRNHLRLLGEISDGLFLLLGLKTDRSCLSDVIVLICGLDTY